jgi:prolyl-tRNA synthetase
MKGVPIRVEMGQRELDENQVVLFRRDLTSRQTVPRDRVVENIRTLGVEIDKTLMSEAEAKFEGLIVDADTIGKIDAAMDRGKIARIPFCTTEMEGLACSEEIKDKTGGEMRGTRTDIEEKTEGVCLVCGKPAKEVVYIARSY